MGQHRLEGVGVSDRHAVILLVWRSWRTSSSRSRSYLQYRLEKQAPKPNRRTIYRVSRTSRCSAVGSIHRQTGDEQGGRDDVGYEHAAGRRGAGRGVDLVAASIWVGSLVCLAVVTAAARRVLDAPSQVTLFRAVGRRYGLVGTWTSPALRCPEQAERYPQCRCSVLAGLSERPTPAPTRRVPPRRTRPLRSCSLGGGPRPRWHRIRGR